MQLSSDTTLRAAKIFFQVIPGLTGKGYIGQERDGSRYAGQSNSRALAECRRRHSDSFFIESQQDSDVLNLAEY